MMISKNCTKQEGFAATAHMELRGSYAGWEIPRAFIFNSHKTKSIDKFINPLRGSDT